MKQIFTAIAITGALCVAITSCKKKETKTDNNSTGGTPAIVYDNFSLKVNGVLFDPSGVMKQHNGSMIVASAAQNVEFYTVAIYDTINPGTYAISEFGAFRLTHSDDNVATTYRSTSGSVTIVSHDKTNDKIVGYYNCTLTRDTPAGTKTVTEGEFNFEY